MDMQIKRIRHFLTMKPR